MMYSRYLGKLLRSCALIRLLRLPVLRSQIIGTDQNKSIMPAATCLVDPGSAAAYWGYRRASDLFTKIAAKPPKSVTKFHERIKFGLLRRLKWNKTTFRR